MMPETTPPNPQEQVTPTATPPGVDKKALEELALAMQDLRTSVDTHASQGWTPSPAATAPVSPPEEDISSPELLDFTDPAVVRKYIKSEIDKLKTETNKAYVVDQARRVYDQLIDQEFPDMQQPSSSIYKETIKEVRRRMAVEGISSVVEMRQKTPSVFYDAACAASVKLNRERTSATPEGQRLSGLTGGYVEGGHNSPPPPPPPPQVTEGHRYFADKFGLDPKVVENIQYAKGSDGVYRLVSR